MGFGRPKWQATRLLDACMIQNSTYLASAPKKSLAQALHIGEDEHISTQARCSVLCILYIIAWVSAFLCIKGSRETIETYIPMYLYLIGLQ